MRVGDDDELRAGLHRLAQVRVLQVQALPRGVKLERGVVRGGGLGDSSDVDVHRGTFVDHPAGGVSDGRHLGVGDGGQGALGGGGFALACAHPRVDAGHHEVALGEHFVRIIERTVGENVALGAGQDCHALDPPVGGTDVLEVLELPRDAQPVGDGAALGMVADGDVLVAAPAGGAGHFLDGVGAVAGHRVHVQVAAEVVEGEQLASGQLGVELAAVLAQLGRGTGQAEPGVDVLFACPGQHGLAVEQAVLVEPQLLLHRELAQADVVLLGAGEVLQGRPERLRGHHAQVDLQLVSVAGDDRHGTFGFAGGQHACNLWRIDEVLDDGLAVFTLAEDVHISDRLGPTADGTG